MIQKQGELLSRIKAKVCTSKDEERLISIRSSNVDHDCNFIDLLFEVPTHQVLFPKRDS